MVIISYTTIPPHKFIYVQMRNKLLLETIWAYSECLKAITLVDFYSNCHLKKINSLYNFYFYFKDND